MSRPDHPSDLTRRESQIMRVLYSRSRATVEEIRATLPDPPSPSTIRKLLEILRDKGEVKREYDGPRHVYYPATPPRQAGESRLRQVVQTFFGGSRSQAVSALLGSEGEALTPEEYRRIRALLDERRREP